MTRYYYDLHIHSCLSPCADNDSTPANIAGMAALNGLGIVALTDHNSTRNCPAFCAAARRMGLVPIPGMELTTAEEVHAICLFPTLEQAMAFGERVEACRIRIPNRPEIFGDQLVMDEDETVIATEPDLLINATSLTLSDAYRLACGMGGVSYPAHIDRPSGGLIAVLGDFPDDPPYTAYELNREESRAEYLANYPHLRELVSVVSSDAHQLGAIAEAAHYVELDDEPYSSRLVAERLIGWLRGEAKE